MKKYQLQIRVQYKDGILDPQAEAIFSALRKLEFRSVQKVFCDKVFRVEIQSESEAAAIQDGRKMAQQLLANIVMENFEVEVISL